MDGVKILDLSVALTGPLATGMLADQGATVIKVERPPFGDQVRFVGTSAGGMTAMFQMANRGKRSIVIDLTDPRGVELVLDLAAEVDVLVHNYRPGATDRMGIGYEAVAARNPDVVYASLSGFGPQGPYSDRRVYDSVVQAQAGLVASQTGRNDEKPVFIRQLMADKVTAYTACQAITAALFARAQGRGGQHLELSMLDATIAFLFVDGAGHEVALDGDHRGPTSAAAVVTALAVDGGHIAVTPVTDDEFHGLAAAFGIDSSDPRLATMTDRFSNLEAMHDVMVQIRDAAAATTLADAKAAMDAHDTPYGVVLPVAEVPDDPQVVASDLFREHEHPTMGRLREPRHPTVFAGTPVPWTDADCPSLGQHTDAVVAEAGWGDRLDELRADGVVG
ncbi:MAG: CoA transferase [Acidimicrobiales bacterium]|nr:CoA transferase [Acidimicrobiales bacterium]